MFLAPVVGTWYPPEWQDELLASLRDKQPPYFLVVRNDPSGQMTSFDRDSYSLLQEFTPLNSWLVENYAQDTLIGDFMVLKNRQFEPQDMASATENPM
jgi:hypothetical protein